jgi:hydroxylamine dehydrogenase
LEAQACLGCHKSQMPGITKDWQDSKHAANGVDCWSCHRAANKPDRADAFYHNGYRIVTLVTPQDCAACHSNEAAEFQASRHANAATFIGSLDNILGEIIGGGPAADSGCHQCHGSDLSKTTAGVLQASAWPNTGVGRLNPDGSKGTCTACHSRHVFSVAQARQPEICAKCHLGPDHPQMEIWQESKHGIRYTEAALTGQDMNLNAPAGQWLPGRDYSAGPTCATCHMGPTPSQAVTHDVGSRLSWTLRPAVSTKQENWETKRTAMQDICNQCHSKGLIDNHYTQLDSMVTLYNDKFGTPSKTIMDKLTAENKLTTQPFDSKLKWTYYELWHHEGRRDRHGAAMGGPDYAWWHGLYDVSKAFYTDFTPAARELDPQVVDSTIGPMSEHDWYTKGLSKDQIQQIIDFYNQRYGQSQ